MKEIKADIQTYRKWYNVNGFFIDEVEATTTYRPYYKNISSYIKGLNASNLVVLNPGTIPDDQAFMIFADVVVIHEDDISTLSTFKLPAWLCKVDPKKICLIYYNANTSTSMLNAVAKTKKLNTGYVYITDDVLSNPYDTLPTYYQEEYNALAATSTNVTCNWVAPFIGWKILIHSWLINSFFPYKIRTNVKFYFLNLNILFFKLMCVFSQMNRT